MNIRLFFTACFSLLVASHIWAQSYDELPSINPTAIYTTDEVLTDNMKSVVTGRDLGGRPVWQRDYAAFMGCVGFRTRLCKPRHPFTKGKVERLIRFVKGNFLAGRDFTDDALTADNVVTIPPPNVPSADALAFASDSFAAAALDADALAELAEFVSDALASDAELADAVALLAAAFL